MFFVPQDLDIIWVSRDMKVVTVKHCPKASWNPKTWKTYWPEAPAQYVIELLDAKSAKKGDKIEFIEK
jgi:uncharacterized membrane protein (UPF0127 family)